MNIKQKLLPVPSQRRSGIPIEKIKYIVCHDTGGPMATAQNEVDYYTRSANDMQASAHAFVDDQEAIWCVPETEKAWHVRYNAGIAPNLAGNFANDHALGIELCYFPSNVARSQKAYENYCELIASLCTKHNLKPLSDLIGHTTLDPSRRTDPLNAFGYIKKTWEQFLVDVSNKMKNNMEENTPVVENLDVTVETPQVLTVNKVVVHFTKTVEGKVLAEGEFDLDLTDAVLAEVKAMQDPAFNIVVTK